MKFQTCSALLVACLTLHYPANAQLPKIEQKTAFCATSVDVPRKHDSNDMYLCETKEYTCGIYLKASCLDDAKMGGWQVASGKPKSVLRDFANTPCNCVGTEYVLTRNAVATGPVAVTTTPGATTAALVSLPAALPIPAPPEPVANAQARSLTGEVESLKQDNLQIRRQVEQLQRQVDELRHIPVGK